MPLRWWVQGTMLVATFWLAVIVAVDDAQWIAWAVTAVAMTLLGSFLRSIGGARVVVADGMLTAGRARIEVHHLGAPEPLDADQARRAAGVEADARAYLLLRPYLDRAVKVPVLDPADPTPYWLIGSREPEALVAALVTARASATGAPGDDGPTA